MAKLLKDIHRVMVKKLMNLCKQHTDLDTKISALFISNSNCCNIDVQRLKREKLKIKDKIAELESSLHPNIVA
jgi:hypothetical protein